MLVEFSRRSIWKQQTYRDLSFVEHTYTIPTLLTRTPSKMKWTAEKDRVLLLVGLGKEIVSREYAEIAKLFEGKYSVFGVMNDHTSTQHSHNNRRPDAEGHPRAPDEVAWRAEETHRRDEDWFS